MLLQKCTEAPKSPDFLALFAPQAVGRTADLSPEGGTDEISITYPISSSHHYHYTPFNPPHPSLSFPPPHFPRCLVTLAPVILPLPSFMVEERKREGEREAAAHYHHVPRGLLLGCPSCCSVQLWLSTRPWPAGILTLPQSQKKSHSVWELIASLAAFSQGELHRHWRHLQLPNLSARAEKILYLSMAVAPRALALPLPLVLALLTLAPAPILGGCPKACRCSFAMLQCLEPVPGIASIPALAPQESENVTEMWVWWGFMYYMRWHAWHWWCGKLDFQFGFTVFCLWWISLEASQWQSFGLNGSHLWEASRLIWSFR